MATPIGSTPCRVCEQLADRPALLVELDLLMGDPARWPKTVWGEVTPPKGSLTAGYWRYGAIEMGFDFLVRHGIETITRKNLERHQRYDVMPIARSPDELVEAGVITAGDGRASIVAAEIEPGAYLKFYNAGIKLGNRGLELIEARLEEALRLGQEIPIEVLFELTKLGSKLAQSQATIRAAGKKLGDDGDEEEAFRVSSSPPPSPRMGHSRVRTLPDGSRVPVHDEGPADRAHYNERAAQEGGPTLSTR